MDYYTDSFVMFHPSDACSNIYPENTQSNFKILFNKPIELNRNMECALLEIILSNDILSNGDDVLVDELYNKEHLLYIYFNSIHENYINDEKAKLLRMFSIKFDKSKKCTTIYFNVPLYIPLNNHCLDELHFEIILANKYMKFKSGRTVLTLMFRPVEHF